MARTIIFGDVHGCIDELRALLAQADPQPGDRVISAGDLVHKGPDDAAVVKLCRELGIELVLGNHEQQQANFRTALNGLRNSVTKGGVQTVPDEELVGRIKVRDDAARAERWATEKGLSPEDIAYLESARLFIEVPGGIVVHGGIMPSLTRIPTDAEIAAMDKGEYSKLAMCTRVRFLRGKAESTVTVEFRVPDNTDNMTVEEIVAAAVESTILRSKVKPVGGFIPLLEDGPDDFFWAKEYDGRFGHVYFGHEAVKGSKPREFPHATCLDTACVKGASLSGVVIDNDTLDKHYIVIPAFRCYNDVDLGDD